MNARIDPAPPDRSTEGTTPSESGQSSDRDERDGREGEQEQLDDQEFLRLIAQAERVSKEFLQKLNRRVAQSYRAYRNEHSETSKYLGSGFRGRSRLFVPKTRAAVRKTLSTAAAALFSTEDVVSIEAEYQDDPQQLATAAVIRENLNYRLNRTNEKAGMPWFLISMGACLDAQLTGVCGSKQYWEYREVETGETETVPVMTDDGMPVFDEETGEPEVEEQPVVKVTRDRPMVDLIPIENLWLDPAAPWYDPAQQGAWLIARYPMHIGDVRAMMESGDKDGSNGGWKKVDDGDLLQGRPQEDTAAVKRAREGGSDRHEEYKQAGDFEVVWINENFVRVNGEDWHFWSVGSHVMLSDPRPTDEVYPAHQGQRPYVVGVAALESHRVVPMSPVESWQPLQLEINDVTNLRLDALKRSIAPITKVRRGKNVDLQAVQRRGQPDATILLDNLDDVDFEATPPPTGQTYTDQSVTNSQFDELSGTFSSSSIESNRRMNETVGGMQMLQGSANSLTEFDLRVWVETYVEPVLRQLIHLLQFYESDEKILAIAGSKAQVMHKYGVAPELDDLLASEVMLRVNVGIGASDPMQRLAKLQHAFEMLMPLGEEMRSQGVRPNMEAVIEEVMGGAGYRDGMRFFHTQEEGEQNEIPPEQQLEMEKLKLEREKLQLEREKMMLQAQTDIATTDMQTEGRVAQEVIKSKTKLAGDQMQADRERVKSVAEAFAGKHGEEGQAGGAQGQQQGGAPFQPPQPDVQDAVSDALMQQMGQVSQQVQAVAQMLDQMGQKVNQLEGQMNAPTQVLRDDQGNIIGAQRGDRVTRLLRDQHGQAVGATGTTGAG